MFGKSNKTDKPQQQNRFLESRPIFHKINTVDNLFASFYGFQNGRLLVQVYEARNLPKKEPSCYCELQLEKQKHKTQVVMKDNLPKWNEEFCFDAQDSSSELIINVYHSSKLIIGRAKPLGQVTIRMKSLIDGSIKEGWWPINNISNNSQSSTNNTSTQDKKENRGTGSVNGNIGGNKGDTGGKEIVTNTIAEIYLKIQYTSEVDRNRDYIIAKENKVAIMNCLMHHDLVILSTLCRVFESEELSKTIIRIFNAENQALRLLIQLIFRDLKSTSSEEIIFRNDSMATKTTRNYFKMIAPDYLRSTLSELVVGVIEQPRGYEVDPNKLHPGESIEKNQQNLLEISQKFLDAILKSANQLPLNMRRFFNLLRQLVKPCFPNKELRSIGALFFLRFVAPAITSPHSFGVIFEELNNPEARRTLTFIAKMIQNLANEITEFKEDFMYPLTPFITSNLERIQQFYDEISTVPSVGPPDASRSRFTEEDKVKCLSLIVGLLIKNIAPMEKKLIKDPRMKAPEVIEQNQEQFKKLKEILMKPIDSLDVRVDKK